MHAQHMWRLLLIMISKTPSAHIPNDNMSKYDQVTDR